MAVLCRGGLMVVVVLLLAVQVREAAARAAAGGGPSSWHHQGVSAYVLHRIIMDSKEGKGMRASQVMTDTDLTNRLNKTISVMFQS